MCHSLLGAKYVKFLCLASLIASSAISYWEVFNSHMHTFSVRLRQKPPTKIRRSCRIHENCVHIIALVHEAVGIIVTSPRPAGFLELRVQRMGEARC